MKQRRNQHINTRISKRKYISSCILDISIQLWKNPLLITTKRFQQQQTTKTSFLKPIINLCVLV